MAQSETFGVCLVGRRLPDNDQLGLGYLEAALIQAGVAVEVLVLNDARDITGASNQILALAPGLVGLSLPDGGSAIFGLALGEMLSRRGYRGCTVAGGPFATLARQWLLERYPWLGGVVRFAGEVPIVDLVHALTNGEDISSVPGLTTRAGDGQPAPVLAKDPLLIQPRHRDLPNILGKHLAHVQATRGCRGRCAYCGPAALQTLELDEGRRAQIPDTELRRAGVGGVRRRPLGALCAEVASLYRAGTRYVYFVDEHFLPYAPGAARQYLSEFEQGLRKRRVGAIGFGCMLRAERIDRETLALLRRAGFVRLFIGIEFASAEEGRAYCRHVDPQHGFGVLAAAQATGIAAVANLMLIHTRSDRHTIRHGLSMLRTADAGLVEATRMMVYHGTRLASELEQAGRLVGNPLRYGYRLDDPVAERFASAMAELRLRAFGDHSLIQRVHEVALTYRLAQLLYPTTDLRRIGADCAELERMTRALVAQSLADAFGLIERGEASHWSGIDAGLSALVLQAAVTAGHVRQRATAVEREIAACVRVAPSSFAPMRAAAASALGFTLLGAVGMGSGCGHSVSMQLAQGGWSGTSNAGGSSNFGGVSATLGAGGTRITRLPVACAEDVASAVADSIRAELADQVPCFYGRVSNWLGSKTWWVEPSYTALGYLHDCTRGSYTLEQRAQSAIQEIATPDCTLTVSVDGEAKGQLDSIEDALTKANCPVGGCGAVDFNIVLDASGAVVDVVPTSAGTTEDAVDCIRSALAGLTFPCLASSEVCPEPCLLE